MSEMTAAQKDRFMADLKVVVADAEELLKLTASDLGEGASSLRARMQERLGKAKETLSALQASATERAKVAGHAADDYVHAKPWQSVAIGAGIGLLVGLLIGRR